MNDAERPSPTDANRRRVIAYHEAGHAAMVFFYGKNWIEYIDLRADESKPPRVRMLEYTPDDIAAFQKDDMRNATNHAKMYIMIKFAGPAAQCSVDVDSVEGYDDFHKWFNEEVNAYERCGWQSSPCDFTDACEAAKALHGSRGRKWFQFMRQVADWSNELILHPRMDAIVDALANTLLREQFVKGETAWEIMTNAWGYDGCPLSSFERKWRRRVAVPVD